MQVKHMKIGLQLLLGFSLVIAFVLILAMVSFSQSTQLHHQTQILYNHPLVVRRAIGKLETDIAMARMALLQMTLAYDESERLAAYQTMELAMADADAQFKILETNYLGSADDVKATHEAFIRWQSAREELIQKARAADVDSVARTLRSGSPIYLMIDDLLANLKKIDDFALAKGDSLYNESNKLRAELGLQLFVLLVAILILSTTIIYILARNIRKPINILTQAAHDFHRGDLSARSGYDLDNEFGTLSDSFNDLAGKIQNDMDMKNQVEDFSRVLLAKDESKEFFTSTLNALCGYTGAQMAAVYLLDDQQETYQPFVSIGLGPDEARASFNASTFDGQFGTALASGKLQVVRDIPSDIKFTYNTVSGKYIPHEIITIPIKASGRMSAVISLMSINQFGENSIELLSRVLDILCTRVEGVLALRRIHEFSQELGRQNQELDAQRNELSAQAMELRQQNKELEIQETHLKEASRLKTSFLSNMSHELRTPLNSVIALSGVLSRRLAKQIPNEEFSYLEVIERNGKSLLALINDILDISRIEAGREEVEVQIFSMTHLVNDLVAMLEPVAREKNIGLIHHQGGMDISITSDQDKCRHIIQNLLANAVKFTEKGTVEVSVQASGAYLKVIVQDTGIGIAPEAIPHIFDEFRQADGSTSRKYGGAGLGLAIAKKYADLLGGTISVASTVGNGSEFTVSLPLRYPSARTATESTIMQTPLHAQEPSNTMPTDQTGRTILLVEDSEPAIIQIKDLLSECGYRMLIARNGSEAFGIIDVVKPDAIILDLMMPEVDGFKVLGALREAETTAYIPVLILTAKQITKDELKFLKRNNVHQLIQKGDVNRQGLKDAVAAMLDSSRIIKDSPPPSSLQPPPPPPSRKPKILVVEDNPDNMTTVKALLEDEYEVIGATDGLQGVVLAKSQLPDLILMDIELPGMNGIEAFIRIRKAPETQHIPVLALTASALVADRETILSHGFDAFIAKPIIHDSFHKILKEVLDGR